VKISELEGKRVVVWGFGREGRAALAALRRRLPGQPLALLCSEFEAEAARSLEDPDLTVATAVDADALAAFEVVVKSPGISPYASPAADAALHGTRFVGGTSLWFGEHAGEHTVCVTGTKGKSTVTALIAHLLRAGGERTALAGNIGLPLLELLDAEPPPRFWAIELSSYQTREARPEVAVVLNLFPEHLDWHGSQARYFEDKLALVEAGAPRVAVLNAADPRVAAARVPESTQIVWFNREDGWHLRDGDLFRGDERVLNARGLPVPGRHNRINLCAALAAIDALGLDAVDLAPHALGFVPLPHRLQSLGTCGGIEYVNDSISTTPHASLAALDCYRGRRVVILVGGYDRGLDWGVFVDRMASDPPSAVITMGQNGAAVYDSLDRLGPRKRFALVQAQGLEDGLRSAQALVGSGGVVLLSPGAPSFPRYKDYVERGRHFTQLAGFDPERISPITGLGVS